jgi:hypothetical protein
LFLTTLGSTACLPEKSKQQQALVDENLC